MRSGGTTNTLAPIKNGSPTSTTLTAETKSKAPGTVMTTSVSVTATKTTTIGQTSTKGCLVVCGPPPTMTDAGSKCHSLTDASKTALASIATLPDLALSEETERLLPGLDALIRDSLLGVLGSASDPSEPPEPLDDGMIASSVALVAESMTTDGRVYHALQHIFDISKFMDDPMTKLAAVWHDVVYYSIDKDFSPKQQALLDGVLVPAKDAGGRLVLQQPLEDPLMELVANMYGFEPGEPLPACGTNEFLSALIGVRAMSAVLSVPQLLQLAACIESTIPFRGVDKEGNKPTDRLFKRLLPISRAMSLPDQWAIDTVHKAVITANNDLGSFDSTNRDYFIDATWKLIPEGRPQLADKNCPLAEFRTELTALQGRCVRMPVAVIFQSFQDEPSTEDLEGKRERTWDNLGIVKQYGQVRLLQVRVLLDMMAAIGADPSSLMLHPCLALTVPFSPESAKTLSGSEQEIRRWLASGRRIGFDWDPAASSIGALLFDTLGLDGVVTALDGADAEPESPFGVLKYVPLEALEAIAAALADHVPSHAEELRQLPGRVHGNLSG